MICLKSREDVIYKMKYLYSSNDSALEQIHGLNYVLTLVISNK